jgi:hypothetical protein
MKTTVLDVPAFTFVVGTRAVLAAGIGLLLSKRFPAGQRRAIGATLVAIGTATTIPAAISVIRGLRQSRRRGRESGFAFDKRLIGATRFPRKGDDDVE